MATYRYWRLYITRWMYAGAPVTTTGDIRVTEWELHDASATKWPTSAMTDATTPSPFVASASSDDGSRPGFQAFNNDTGDGSRWISAINPGGPQWLKIDLGSAVDIRSIKIAPDSLGGTTHHLVDFEVHGSSTGAFTGEHDVVAAYTDLTSGWGSSTLRTFAFLSISGTVHDIDGVPAARTVRAYLRSTGALVSSVTSSAADGTYKLPVAENAEHTVVALPVSTAENALVLDRVLPA